MKKEEILYTYGDDALYVNLTNRCPCSCTFCIRHNGDGLGSAESLWLEHDPSIGEIFAAFEKEDLSKYSELVFCGYGEPTYALYNLLETCRYVKDISMIPIRLNTNGLADLIWEKPIAPLLKGLIDTVSVSLNAPDVKKYCEVTRPKFGEKSFAAMIKFAQDCKEFVPNVVFSVVDVISKEDIEKSKELAESVGVKLRVREYTA